MCGLLLGRRTATSGHGMLSQWTPLTIQLTRARVLQHVAQAGGGFRLKPQWLLCLSPFSLACLLACLHGVWARGRLPLAQGKRYAGCPSLGFCLFSLSLSHSLSLFFREGDGRGGDISLSLPLSPSPHISI